MKDRNLIHRVDTMVNIFTSGAATSENITDGVHEKKYIESEIAINVWEFTEGSWVRAALDPLGFFVGVSLGKTLQSPSLVLVKPRKDMNNVSCCRDITEILLKAA